MNDMTSEATRTKYPGMRGGETRVMQQWLRIHESEFDSFAYNVRIGVARDPGPAFTDAVRRSAMLFSQLRMDCVASKGKQSTLIELKNWAFSKAVQQLALYGAVWRMDFPELPPPALLLVCRVADASAWTSAPAAHVTIEELGIG